MLKVMIVTAGPGESDKIKTLIRRDFSREQFETRPIPVELGETWSNPDPWTRDESEYELDITDILSWIGSENDEFGMSDHELNKWEGFVVLMEGGSLPNSIALMEKSIEMIGCKGVGNISRLDGEIVTIQWLRFR